MDDKIVIPFGVVHHATLNNSIHETREIIKVRDGDENILCELLRAMNII